MNSWPGFKEVGVAWATKEPVDLTTLHHNEGNDAFVSQTKQIN